MSLGQWAPVALATALLLGCQSIVPVAPVDRGVPIPADDARALGRLDAYRTMATGRGSLRAAARLSIESSGVSLTRPQRLVVRRPASLRIEILGLFDQVAGMIATDGVEFAFIDLTSGVRDGGPVDDGLLWRTARVDLTPSDAVALLLGAPAIDAGAEVVEARQFEDGGIGVATRAAHGTRTRWHEWDAAGRLRRAELREPASVGAATSPVWLARFSDWREASGQPFAHRIELDFPRVDSEASVRFQSVELEPALSDGLFVLQVPPGG